MLAKDEFYKGENFSLHWRGLRHIVKPSSNFVYCVEDLGNVSLDDVHVSRLKFYHSATLDEKEILVYVVSSETEMVDHQLTKLLTVENNIMEHVRWRGLLDSEDTFEPLKQIYEDVPELFLKILKRNNSPTKLIEKACSQL